MNGHHGLENYAQTCTFLAVTNEIHAYIIVIIIIMIIIIIIIIMETLFVFLNVQL